MAPTHAATAVGSLDWVDLFTDGSETFSFSYINILLYIGIETKQGTYYGLHFILGSLETGLSIEYIFGT